MPPRATTQGKPLPSVLVALGGQPRPKPTTPALIEEACHRMPIKPYPTMHRSIESHRLPYRGVASHGGCHFQGDTPPTFIITLDELLDRRKCLLALLTLLNHFGPNRLSQAPVSASVRTTSQGFKAPTPKALERQRFYLPA